MKKNKPVVLAYYFPNWHVDPRNEEWHGEGWTEWEVLKCTTPKFEGHNQPLVPVWGYEDEADPKVMEKKIDAAVNHGIDGFVFDWYWFNDGGYRTRCLEEGFLKAKNCNDAKFAVMWCNHDPIYVHPAGKYTGEIKLHSGDLSVQGFIEGTEHCIKKYFNKPNYLRNSKGELYFSIFFTKRLVENFGGAEGTRLVFEDFRQRVRNAGLGEIDISAIAGGHLGLRDNPVEANELMKKIGVNSYSAHGVYTNWEIDPFPHLDFKNYMKDNADTNRLNNKLCELPYNPHISVGWDSSPRTIPSEKYGRHGSTFTYIINNNSPELIEELCRNTKDFYYNEATGEYITIYAWNEWTEGGLLEPDTRNGYGRLEAVKAVFKDEQSIYPQKRSQKNV